MKDAWLTWQTRRAMPTKMMMVTTSTRCVADQSSQCQSATTTWIGQKAWASVSGEMISENTPNQENDDSEKGEIRGVRWYLRNLGIAAPQDSSKEGTKHGNCRECIGQPINTVC
jgi:hypothetical protein